MHGNLRCVLSKNPTLKSDQLLLRAPSRSYPAYLPLACAWMLWFAGRHNWLRGRRGEVGKKITPGQTCCCFAFAGRGRSAPESVIQA